MCFNPTSMKQADHRSNDTSKKPSADWKKNTEHHGKSTRSMEQSMKTANHGKINNNCGTTSENRVKINENHGKTQWITMQKSMNIIG